MRTIGLFGTFFLSGSLSVASSLAVYQDSTFYSFSPPNTFIGFTQGVEAKCEGTMLQVEAKSDCPKAQRLCGLLTSLEEKKEDLQELETNTNILNQLILLPRPASFDASASIGSAKTLSGEQSRLRVGQKQLSEEILIAQGAFEQQAPSMQAQYISPSCAKEVELRIPYGYVTFSSEYEAKLENEKEVSVTQYLKISNKSGIDIKADTALFYYRSATQTVHPIDFNPWIVSKYEPESQVAYESATAEEVSVAAPMSKEKKLGAALFSTPQASYEDAREYKINALDLPSTGVPLVVPVLSWKAPLECQILAYPYENTKAFQVCSFTPKHQIDTHQWKVKSNERIINESARGEYKKDKYDLYTKVEEDIQITRKPIVNKEGEEGIFGGTIHKKDGFTLEIVNKSDKPKTLKLIERIPSSTTEEIHSKLLSVKAETKIDYTLLDEGKIEINLTLAARETKKIEVLFELSYDKDVKVSY